MTDREREVEESRIAEYIEREKEAFTFSIFDIYKESNVGDFCRTLDRLFLRFACYPMQDFYNNVYNLAGFKEIEGIENAGLDCWGRFLNIPRTIQYTDVNGKVATYRLSDIEYKGAIKNKLFTYFTNGTLEDINSNLKNKLLLSAYVVDNQNMTQVNYFLQEEIRLWNIALLKDYGTVPRAMGVSVEVTDIADRFISFEGQYLEGEPSPDGYMTNFFNAIFHDDKMTYNNEDITTKEEPSQQDEPKEEGEELPSEPEKEVETPTEPTEEVKKEEEGEDKEQEKEVEGGDTPPTEPDGTEETEEGKGEEKEGEVEPSNPDGSKEGGDTDTDTAEEKEEDKEPAPAIDEEEEKRKQEEEEKQRLEEEQRLKEEEERKRQEEERLKKEQEEKERAEREAEEQRQREEEERLRQEEERKKQEEDKMNEFVKRMQVHLNISQSPVPAMAIMNVDNNISVIMAETEAIANMYLELKDKIDVVDIREYMTHFEGDTVTFFHHLRRALGYVLTNISRPYHRTSYTTGAVSQQGAMYTLSEDKKQKYLDNLRVIYDFLTTQFLKYITFTPTDTLKTPLDIFDLIRETAIYSDKHARFISGTSRTEAQYIQKWGSLDIMKNCVDRVEAIKEWIAKNGEEAGWLSIKSYNSSPNSLSASVEFCYYATNGIYSKNNYGTAWFSEINTKLENSYTLLKVKITDDYILSEVI